PHPAMGAPPTRSSSRRARSCSTSPRRCATAECRPPARASGQAARPAGKHGFMADRLRNATSPYLLQHADNPVDWWPWSPEAFAEARERDVPLLISVGYAACHWCHVMAHESFADDDVAKVMNEHFVAIKVDREERPDVDAVYMTA